MPEKQYLINNRSYTLSFGQGQEEELDQLINILNQRIGPYAKRFSEYSETYLMLLLALELVIEVESLQAGGNQVEDSQQQHRLQALASRADALVKKSKEY